MRRSAEAATLACLAGGLAGVACSPADAPEPSPSAPPVGTGGSWAQAAPLREARQEVGVAELQGRIYVVGGYRADQSTASTVEVYDPATDTWSFAAPMPLALNHCAAVSLGGRLYVAGGSLPSGAPSAALLEYDPARNDWGVRAPMPSARSAPMAAVMNGRIHVAGGTPSGRAFEAWDPLADRWTTLPLMPTERNHVAGGVTAGRFFAVGGRPPNTLAVNEAFDPVTNSWSRRAPLPTGRSGHAAAVVAGCLYVMGGEGNAGSASGVFPQNEAYDHRSDSWGALAPMPTPRHGIGAAVLGDRLFVPGGASVQGFGAVAVHEVFTIPAGRTCL